LSIRSFRHKGVKRLFEDGNAKGVLPSLADKIGDILAAIDAAVEIEDVSLFPGWRLHPLKGDFRDFWSVTVSGNWRIIFRFEGGNAFELDLVDYH
jgi:proteic killer suppression protein